MNGPDALTPTAWTTFQPASADPRLRLLCFPYAGGCAASYRAWPAWVPPDVEVTAVRLPGRDGRTGEPFLRKVQDAAGQLGALLAGRQDKVPWIFVGHSLGAWLAYETVQWLLRHGEQAPDALVVMAASAPHLPRRYPPTHRLPDPALLERLGRLGALPQDPWRDLRFARLWLPRIRADLEMYDTYSPTGTEPLPCPLVALAGDADPVAPVEDVAQWRLHAGARWSLRVWPGGHFFVQEDAARILSELFSEELASP